MPTWDVSPDGAQKRLNGRDVVEGKCGWGPAGGALWSGRCVEGGRLRGTEVLISRSGLTYERLLIHTGRTA